MSLSSTTSPMATTAALLVCLLPFLSPVDAAAMLKDAGKANSFRPARVAELGAGEIIGLLADALPPLYENLFEEHLEFYRNDASMEPWRRQIALDVVRMGYVDSMFPQATQQKVEAICSLAMDSLGALAAKYPSLGYSQGTERMAIAIIKLLAPSPDLGGLPKPAQVFMFVDALFGHMGLGHFLSVYEQGGFDHTMDVICDHIELSKGGQTAIQQIKKTIGVTVAIFGGSVQTLFMDNVDLKSGADPLPQIVRFWTPLLGAVSAAPQVLGKQGWAQMSASEKVMVWEEAIAAVMADHMQKLAPNGSPPSGLEWMEIRNMYSPASHSWALLLQDAEQSLLRRKKRIHQTEDATSEEDGGCSVM